MHRSWIGALLMLPMVAACGETNDAGATPAAASQQPLAKVEGWRDGLIESLDGDQPYALVEIAFDRAAAERAWVENVPPDLEPRTGEPEEPGRYGDLDAVDFDSQAVVVWSSGESSACPAWLAEINTDAEGTVALTTGQVAATACTDDFNPYRMVLVVDRNLLPDPTWLPTTDVVVDDRPLPAVILLVRAYP